jgi:GMP synthase (glutamine-hydrolysing)
VPTALVIQHEDYESLAGFREPLIRRGYTIEMISVRNPHFEHVDFLEPDLLVIMGGPMGVYEQAAYPWMNHEIIRVAERIIADLPTLGVCLGSQVMAAAMGSAVFKGMYNEVGFRPITLTATGRNSALAPVEDLPLLHWHGDTFDLPEGVTLLASSDLYPNQAFARGPNILALQFHPEMGEDESFATWCEKGDPFIEHAGTDVETLHAEHEKFGPAAVAAGRELLNNWLVGLDVQSR